MLIGGAILAVVGATVFLLGPRPIGVVVFVLGFLVEVSGALVHDRLHRRRGEQPHAMWGEADRNRPRWLGDR